MGFPFENHDSWNVRDCEKCGASFGSGGVIKVVDSLSGFVVCQGCERRWKEKMSEGVSGFFIEKHVYSYFADWEN